MNLVYRITFLSCKMNRLIIIGNGFDLAHGLKTSFKDFIADYLVEVINFFIDKQLYKDELLEVSFSSNYRFSLNSVTTDNSIQVFRELRSKEGVRIFFKSKFVENVIIRITDVNWVDIEVEYYRTLLLCKSGRFNVKTLNIQFEFLKKRLLNYLKAEERGFDKTKYSANLQRCFSEDFNRDEFIRPIFLKTYSPENIYFLNFNYTNVLRKYYDRLEGDSFKKYICIHGDLDKEFGDPIFGFGDEFDQNYKEIEELNDNEYFKHIKSFEYSKKQNYFSFIRNIDSLPFQVYIFGHSCGLSDRTMLNTIFEHENCKSIKVFYHGEKGEESDFIDKLNNISRHFKDKTLLREKVVPLDMCKPMPQPIEEFKAKVNGSSSSSSS